MTPRANIVAAFALCVVLVSEHAAARVTIQIDATAGGPALEPVWAYFGYDEVNYTNTEEGTALLRELAAMHSSPVHVRTHFLFNSGDGTPSLKWGSTDIYGEDARGNPVYDYTLIDRIMDATLQAGTFPLVEIGFMPEALSAEPSPYQNTSTYVLDGGCFHPPDDYEAWGALVTAWATHVRERYPDAERTWQWELWNEPDIAYWQGTFEEFTRLYDTTEAALHGVLPAASLGGPAVARTDSEFFARFLEHCRAGTNAVTGEVGTRLDMVSFHGKGWVALVDDHVQMDLGLQLRGHRAGFDVVARSAFRSTPVVISEADPEGCAACPVSTAPHNAYRNSSAYGAYEVAMMKHTIDLAEEAGVDLRGVLTWAFTFPESPYFAGYRALSTNGIRLPVMNAFQLLGQLRGERLSVASSGALGAAEIVANGVRAEPDIDALAARDGERVHVLVWNYHDDLVEVGPTTVTVEVALPARFGRTAEFTHTRVDDQNGNAHRVWQLQGSPLNPSRDQLVALREAMGPVELERNGDLPLEAATATVTFELPRFGVSLLTFVPASGESSPRKAGPGCSCGVSRGRTWQSTWVALSLVLMLRRRRTVA